MSRSRDLANLGDEATGGLVKADIGLGNVDNTSDANKPVSTAQQTALDAKQSITNSDKLAHQSVPHIIPGVLYPAVSGKLLDGTTTHGTGTYDGSAVSTNYGTTQSDGRKYYYTDIKGSKPIKDPRIGAHFGSQRHKFKSIQLLEQETATHGENVYSVDGREWIRQVGFGFYNNNNGNFLNLGDTDKFYEITAYCSGINLINLVRSAATFRYTVDGGTEVSTDYGANSLTSYPLGSRYVDAGSVSNLTSSLTLGIHTIKIRRSGTYGEVYGIELIAQDTTSTANRSKIQIPSQDVVSYGKKFTVNSTNSGFPATGLHYNPFAFKTDGSTAWASGAHNGTSLPVGTGSSHNIDTATSLGLENWKHTDGNYYKPYNGGRVVLWIDNTGVLKTSVTVMPPLAKSIADSNNLTPSAISDSITAASANSEYRPYFGQNDAYDASGKEAHDGLHEVAKTFYAREFGNGSANAGTGGSYGDTSMVNNTGADRAFVMDDGLTGLSGDQRDGSAFSQNAGIFATNASDPISITFIGTGIDITQVNASTITATILTKIDGVTIQNAVSSDGFTVNNLPYGTHIVQLSWSGSGAQVPVFEEVTIFQPKKPPIPEEAVIISDYCLLADFVPQTSAGDEFISKGVRRQHVSRDCFCDETDNNSFTFNIKEGTAGGFRLYLDSTADSDTSMKVRIPSFGTNYVHRGYQSDTRSKLFIGDTDNDSNATKDNTAGYGSYAHLTSSLSLGVYNFGSNAVSGQNGNVTAYDIATPIHTSFHYTDGNKNNPKTGFETPFLIELVGGDRNLEQHTLVCSADGKTWDEVTRDTSYLGNIKLIATNDENWGDVYRVYENWRGQADESGNNAYRINYNKDFAIAYDRFICLVDGDYEITVNGYYGSSGYPNQIHKNGSVISMLYQAGGSSNINATSVHLVRGDYIQIKGSDTANMDYDHVTIKKV